MSLTAEIKQLAQQAQRACGFLGTVCAKDKNNALKLMSQQIEKKAKSILLANKKDVAQAQREKKSAAFIDRLTLNNERIKKMSADLESIVSLADPVGAMIKM